MGHVDMPVWKFVMIVQIAMILPLVSVLALLHHQRGMAIAKADATSACIEQHDKMTDAEFESWAEYRR